MSKEKILITGASGLVGSRFVEKYVDNFQLITPEYPDFDLTRLEDVRKIIEKENPDWIINFAAFTDVNSAEAQFGDESGSAWKINVEGTENLQKTFLSKNFIQISTDMVFPGDLSQPGPYSETDIPPDSSDKLTWYGWTKNRAEKLVLSQGGTVLRIIYPVREKFNLKLDYIRGALKKFAEGKMYPLFDDQQICISYIDEVADTLSKIIETDSHGVFHCSSDTTTPYELISYVVDQLGEDASLVKSASINEFLKSQANPNRYPVWGGLRTVITEEALEMHFSTWQTVVEYLIGQGLSLPKVESSGQN